MIVHDKCMIMCHKREKESVCVCARARMRVFAHVHLRDVSMYSCLAPEHMKLMSFKFFLSSKLSMTSRTWTIKNKTKQNKNKIKTKNVEIGVATFC